MNSMNYRSVIAASGKKFRIKNVSKRVRSIVISPIKEMSILADRLEEKIGLGKIISFGQGIPYFDTPPRIKHALRKALTEPDTAKYTLEPGITRLRELIARHLVRAKGAARVEAKREIMVSAGCQEAMACALATALDPGDEALLLSPAFASHIEQIVQWGGKPVFVPLNEAAGWRFDTREAERRVTKRTKAIVFSNPSNPTGKVFSRAELAALVRLAVKHDLLIISDETYDFLTYDGVRHISLASLRAARGRAIVCGSFSKKYALTGYRVGYAYADEGLIDHMLKVHDALTICAPAISQKAAIAALAGPQASVRRAVGLLAANRARMCKELTAMSDVFEYHTPEGAYYILAKVKRPKMDSFSLSLHILREAHVIVIPGAAFGPGGEGHLRFSFAGDPRHISEGFARLRRWFTHHTPRSR